MPLRIEALADLESFGALATDARLVCEGLPPIEATFFMFVPFLQTQAVLLELATRQLNCIVHKKRQIR